MLRDDAIQSRNGVILWITVLAIIKRVVATVALTRKVERDELEGRVQVAFVQAVRDEKFEYVGESQTSTYIQRIAVREALHMLREHNAHIRKYCRVDTSHISCLADSLYADLAETDVRDQQETVRSLLAGAYQDDLDLIIGEGKLNGKSNNQITEEINQWRAKPISPNFVAQRIHRLLDRVRDSLTIDEEKVSRETVHSLLVEASQVTDLVPEFIAGNLAPDGVRLITETAKEDEELAARIAILGYFAGYTGATFDQSLPTGLHEQATNTMLAKPHSSDRRWGKGVPVTEACFGDRSKAEQEVVATGDSMMLTQGGYDPDTLREIHRRACERTLSRPGCRTFGAVIIALWTAREWEVAEFLAAVKEATDLDDRDALHEVQKIMPTYIRNFAQSLEKLAC